jgi:tetratricopeptide (TPR) repeat protein
MRSGDDPLARAKTLYEMSVTPKRTEEMLGLLDQSAAETAAYAAVTDLCRYLNRWENWGTAELDRFAAIIRRALDYDADYYLALYAQGFLCRARGDHQAALDAFDATIRRAPPGFARVHAQKGEQLVYLGRFDDAIGEVNRALEINPKSKVRGYFYWVTGRANFFKEDYGAAIDWLQRSVRAWPSVWYNRVYLVAAHAHAKRGTAARRVLGSFNDQFPGYTLARVMQNEGATPCDNPAVVAGRERFHAGLRLAGLS